MYGNHGNPEGNLCTGCCYIVDKIIITGRKSVRMDCNKEYDDVFAYIPITHCIV